MLDFPRRDSVLRFPCLPFSPRCRLIGITFQLFQIQPAIPLWGEIVAFAPPLFWTTTARSTSTAPALRSHAQGRLHAGYSAQPTLCACARLGPARFAGSCGDYTLRAVVGPALRLQLVSWPRPALPVRPPRGLPPLWPLRLGVPAVAALPLLPDRRPTAENVPPPPPSALSPPQGGTFSGPALRPASGAAARFGERAPLRGARPRSGRHLVEPRPQARRYGRTLPGPLHRRSAAPLGQRADLTGPQGERPPSRCRRRGVRARRYRCRVLLAREPV